MAANTPRRKRFTAQQRRAAAIHWLPTYSGKSLVNGYSRWFGVDRICALRELMQIEVVFDEKYVDQLRRSETVRIAQKHEARELRIQKLGKVPEDFSIGEFDMDWY
ncbi:MAG: hypothetical protein H7318_10780 [Oligoflexus sp.]|nr:hypothetical protein [Oligoflexus sp.]